MTTATRWQRSVSRPPITRQRARGSRRSAARASASAPTDCAAVQTGWETGKSTLTSGAYDPPAPGAFLYGSGGGTSTLFQEPTYQKGVVPDRLANKNPVFPARVVPDISMDGDPNTGFLVGETQKFPKRSGGVEYDEYRIGGTSLSSPLFAGIMALADDLSGSPHGFINPSLYKLAGSNAITDVVHENGAVVRVDYVNGVDARDGTVTSVRTFDLPGLQIATTPGYDNTTGLGVPNGVPFLAPHLTPEGGRELSQSAQAGAVAAGEQHSRAVAHTRFRGIVAGGGCERIDRRAAWKCSRAAQPECRVDATDLRRAARWPEGASRRVATSL